jgi:hypothetical protein
MVCHFVCRIAHWFQSLSISNWLDLIKIGGAGLAFGIGLWQYRKGQVWKRMEFVAAEMQVFYNDSAVRAAMTMLDWNKKTMTLFKYRDVEDLGTVDVDYEMVAQSLNTQAGARFDKNHSAIREIFERFLEFLARFEGFLTNKVIEKRDLNPYLDYWVKLISGNDAHSPEVKEKVLPALWQFIDYYGYKDVRNFVNRYHKVGFAEYKDTTLKR